MTTYKSSKKTVVFVSLRCNLWMTGLEPLVCCCPKHLPLEAIADSRISTKLKENRLNQKENCQQLISKMRCNIQLHSSWNPKEFKKSMSCIPLIQAVPINTKMPGADTGVSETVQSLMIPCFLELFSKMQFYRGLLTFCPFILPLASHLQRGKHNTVIKH